VDTSSPPESAAGATPPTSQRCGLIAIVGRPNVGKSTLMNSLVGQKISITSNKAQTTRHRITGVRTVDEAQFVFVDTPGFQTKHGAALNRSLNRAVVGTLSDVDLVLFLVEAGRFGMDDAKVLALLQGEGLKHKPVVLVANKLDAVHRRADLLPWLKGMQDRHTFAEYVPMSAHKMADVDRLFAILKPYLPEQPWYYDQDMLTDRSEKFLATEIIREKLFRLTGDELPYTSTVVLDKWEEEDDSPQAPASLPPPPEGAGPAWGGPAPAPGGRRCRISASIVVERDAHKGMIIGEKGERLKRIGSEARQEMERLMEAKVFLELWVKVRSGWADSEEHLRSYGYE
jgi:GTP-binding protein Era